MASIARYFSRTSSLADCTAPKGRAEIHTLDAVDRTDHAGGSGHAPPGRNAAHYLRTTRASEDVAFADLYASDTDFVLYSIERAASDAPFLVFLSLPPDDRRKLWLDEAFIDRGIRKLVALGSRVAVASLETAAEFAEGALDALAAGEWQASFVWNTGRCGSTLLHKAASAMGTASLSEPHWLDQLQFNSLPEQQLKRALRACVALECLTVRTQTGVPGWDSPSCVLLNPKAGGLRVAEAAVRAFPMARHAFMYRACHKVVDSFSGLMFSDGVPYPLVLAWRLLGPSAFSLLSLPFAHGDDTAIRSEMAHLSSAPVAMLTSRWLHTIADWIATTERRAASADGDVDPLAQAIVLRMDEFTSRDLALRKDVVRAALTHLGVVEEDVTDATDEALDPAMAAFDVHSQAGSRMSGPKVQLVTEADVTVIKRCVATALLGTAATVEAEGGNVLLPRSVGARTSAAA